MGLMSSRDVPLQSEADGALLSADTLDALDLHGQPFLHKVGEHQRFVDETSVSQLDDVRQALIAGDDLLLVLGPPGSGRTIMLDVLNDDSGTRIQCFQVAGSERFDTDNLFAGMLEAFKQPAPDDLKLALDELIPYLQGMDERNTLCVVIVDDADTVDENELTRLLSSMLYLNSGDETLLRMVFAASDDFEDRIPDLLPEGADLPYSILGMEPLEADRAAGFLAFRLEQAGHAGALPFDPEEVAALNDRASGRPGTLQSLAAESLNERFGGLAPAPSETGITGNLPVMDDRRRNLVFGAVATVLILAGLLLFLPSPDDSSDASRNVADSASATAEAENAERLRLVRERADEERARKLAAEEAAAVRADKALAANETEERVSAQAGEGDSAANDVASLVEDAPTGSPAAAVPEREPVSEPAPVAEPVAEPVNDGDTDRGDAATEAASSDIVVVVPEDTGSAVDSSDPAAADDADAAIDTRSPAGDASPGGTLSAEELAAEDSNAVATTPAEPPLQTAEIPVENAPADSPPESTDSAGANENPVAPDVTPAPAAQAPSTAGALESPNWILVQAPDQFTVQMIAATNRESVDTFLQQSNLPSPNSVFSFERNGVAWHAMVHGLYPTLEAARAAINDMPEEVRSNEPWIRAIGGLQETVRQQND